MLQRLPTALEKGKAGHISGNFLNEIRQIIYFFVSCKISYWRKFTATWWIQYNYN